MTKNEIIVQALNDHIAYWFDHGIDMKYVAALAKEANYDKDVMNEFVMHDGSIIPEEYLSDNYLTMSRGKQIDLVTNYLKRLNKGEM